MAISLVQSNQVVNDAALGELASAARDSLLTILPAINTAFIQPGKITASGKVITIGNTSVSFPDGRIKALPLVDGVDVSGLSGTYSLVTGTGSGVESLALPTMSNGDYIYIGFEVRSDRKIYPLYGTKNAVAASATLPNFSTGIALGTILLHYSSGAFDDVVVTNINQSESAVPNPASVSISLYETTVTTSSASLSLSHGLAGEPQFLSFFYNNGTTKPPVDASSIVIDKTSTTLVLNTNDFDFTGGKSLLVTAIRLV